MPLSKLEKFLSFESEGVPHSGFIRQCLMQAVKALIFLMIEHNKNENRNVLDVRASLKVGLQMEQDNFPSH